MNTHQSFDLEKENRSFGFNTNDLFYAILVSLVVYNVGIQRVAHSLFLQLPLAAAFCYGLLVLLTYKRDNAPRNYEKHFAFWLRIGDELIMEQDPRPVPLVIDLPVHSRST